MAQKIILLAVAGAFGTLARYGLSGFVHQFNGAYLPWGTLVVNVVGCFLAGLIWTLSESHWPIPAETRTLVLIGFIGSFTTFATLILETGELIRSSQWIWALTNIAAQNVVGLTALFAGIIIARVITS